MKEEPEPPKERPWSKRPEDIAALLRNGGVIFITGIIEGYVPKDLKDYPRFVFYDPNRTDRLEIPSNTRFVCTGRFTRHSITDRIRGECRNRNIPFEYFMSGLGPIWRLLNDVKTALESPVKPQQESPVAVQTVARPAGTWGVAPTPVSTESSAKKPTSVKDFIMGRHLTLDFTKSVTHESKRLHAAYTADGGVATESAFLQALSTWAKKNNKTFAKAYGPRGVGMTRSMGASAPGTVSVQAMPMIDPVKVMAEAPPAVPASTPASAPVPPAALAHSEDDDFAVMRKMIGDAKATLALLEEFVESIQIRERARRERDKRLKELLNS